MQCTHSKSSNSRNRGRLPLRDLTPMRVVTKLIKSKVLVHANSNSANKLSFGK